MTKFVGNAPGVALSATRSNKLGHQALDAIVSKSIRYIVMSKDLAKPEKKRER